MYHSLTDAASEVGRRFRCAMCFDCSRSDPGAARRFCCHNSRVSSCRRRQNAGASDRAAARFAWAIDLIARGRSRSPAGERIRGTWRHTFSLTGTTGARGFVEAARLRLRVALLKNRRFETHRWRGLVWMPSAGQGRFWLGTVMPVAGLCPACSRGNAAGLDGLSASRSSHLDFALDAHSLAAGLPR